MPSEKHKLRLSGFKKKLTFTSPVEIYSRNIESKPWGSARGPKGGKGSKAAYNPLNAIFTESAHCTNPFIESLCPYACVVVCLSVIIQNTLFWSFWGLLVEWCIANIGLWWQNLFLLLAFVERFSVSCMQDSSNSFKRGIIYNSQKHLHSKLFRAQCNFRTILSMLYIESQFLTIFLSLQK